ncbi:hypothetical protein G210_1598 [Candida maltosa Xu316]|uniref:Uncharacterized protein n=1 Tax=Candida maltosa (strain Xu316) TaxID=1245528 RepID=M3HKK5_CANMX|nr:hypothetical protein G210_1598 [Candida maltosa Xu316]
MLHTPHTVTNLKKNQMTEDSKALVKSLLRFPPEVLSIIYSQVPSHFLKRCLSIPQVRPFALPVVYDTISVYNTELWAETSLLGIYDFKRARSVCMGCGELLSIIRNDNLLPCTRIKFYDFGDLIKIHEEFPGILHKCKIDLKFHEDATFIDKFKKLKQLPYRYDRVFDFCFGFANEQEYGPNQDFYEKVNEVVFLWDTPSIFEEPPFRNLKSIGGFSINLSDLKLLPRTLQKANFTLIQYFIDDEDSEIEVDDGKLEDMPNELVELQLTYTESISETLDLQFLQKLETLEVEFSGSFKLPKSLKKLTLEGNTFVDFCQLFSQCSNLTVLHLPRSVPSDSKAFDLPHNLQTLQINLKILAKVSKIQNKVTMENKRQKTGYDSVKFPPRLEKLSISEEYGMLPTNFNIFQQNDDNLIKLKGLWISGESVIKHLRVLPRSLESLTIVSATWSKFHELRYFNNLTLLNISSIILDRFVYKMPKTLETLFISYLDTGVFRLKAANLKYLRITHSKFKSFDKSSFSIPESLVELELNRIEFLDPCDEDEFEFPKNLEVLNSKWVRGFAITYILPSSLTVLDYFNIEPVKIVCNENSNLRELRFIIHPRLLDYAPVYKEDDDGSTYDPTPSTSMMRCHAFFEDWNLNRFSKLRKLSVELMLESEFPLNNFSLDNLPTTLTNFHLNCGSLKSMTGTFERFPDLQQLVLLSSPRNVRCFEHGDTNSYNLFNFGPKLERVRVSPYLFKKEYEFAEFEEYLNTLPNFQEFTKSRYY